MGTAAQHSARQSRSPGIDLTDDADGFSELSPVGSFNAGRTPDGFLDLAGNAAEWVSDRYATQYSDAEQSDPQGPDAAQATSARVVARWQLRVAHGMAPRRRTRRLLAH
ncbi:MAG: SUMF1/EgtB/PvdO family nonheme iron enzyme [Pseudomonadota bacterium]